MATAVQMPKQGNSVTECIITEWRVAEGESVQAGEIVCGIETDKATFDVEAPATGIVLKHFVAAGDLAPVLTNIAAIGEAGEDVTALAPASESKSPTAIANPNSSRANVTAPAPGQVRSEAGMNDRISPRARRLAERLGIDPQRVAGTGPQGRTLSADIQAAAAAGRGMTPLAREKSAIEGLAGTLGSGIGGRIRAVDLHLPIPPAPAAPLLAFPAAAPSAEIPYSGIRRLIGERMRESLLNHAQLTLNAEADAAAILAARKTVKERSAAGEFPNLTLNDMVAYVVARVLPEHPTLNAIFDFSGERILQYDSVQLGIAVDTERGLMVPVIENADALNIETLSEEIAKAAEECRGGAINPDRLQGGTFTITNLGALGITTFTPVLNTPQVAILGICTIQPQAVPDANSENGIRFQPTLGLSLTIDHQVVDGAAGAKFLQRISTEIAAFDLANTLTHKE